jgi:hypothetical protein
MNMLIGVMSEVITAVAAAEKESIQVNCVKDTLKKVVKTHSENGEDMIYQDQFGVMCADADAMSALKDVGVEAKTLDDFQEIIFEEAVEGNEERGRKMSFAQFIDAILELRGSNNATVRDIEKLRKWMSLRMDGPPADRVISSQQSQPKSRQWSSSLAYTSSLPSEIGPPGHVAAALSGPNTPECWTVGRVPELLEDPLD